MLKMMMRFAITCAVSAMLMMPAVRVEAGPSACVLCHTFMGGPLAQPVREWTGSIHQQNGITCDLCHGGNAAVDVGNVRILGGEAFKDRMSRAMSKASGFVGKPSGKAMFAMCGRCHADSVSRFARSIMGKAYLEGRGGPSCVTCHHPHRNTMPDVPKICENCHKDTAGFDQIDPMDVSASTVNALSGIRIKLAQAKTVGKQPPFIPEFPSELGSFQIGFIAFGAVFVLFCFGYVVYLVLERRK